MVIENDQEFKQALSKLSLSEQRQLAARFVNSVVYLNSDPVIERALTIAAGKNHSDYEFEEAYKSVKSLAVKTYTACGGDANWLAQAAHFVALAAKTCLTPEQQLEHGHNLAWKCAMQARMAKNCAMIEIDNDAIDNEAQKQYVILNS